MKTLAASRKSEGVSDSSGTVIAEVVVSADLGECVPIRSARRLASPPEAAGG